MPTHRARTERSGFSQALRLLVCLGVAAVSVASCGPAGEREAKAVQLPGDEPGRLKIVCTTGMIADTVRGLTGENADVTGLMGPGTDPHLYTPTRSDLAAIMEADVVFYNGLHLEGRMIEALGRASESGKRVVAVAEGLGEDQLLAPAEFEGLPDPHVWMDPSIWLTVIDTIHAELVEADPGRASLFDLRKQAYRPWVERVDAYAAEALATVPEDRRALVTAHDAFNYFGRRYGFQVIGIQGISTESEAGVRDIERLVTLLVDRKIPAVFVETTVSERNIRALIDGARARGHEVVIGGSLYSDAMGPPGTHEGRYPGMIDHNVTTIVRALGGRAPERGMDGELAENP